MFDLLDEAPDKVLHKLYSNLERLKHGGDTLASEIYRRLRLIVSATRQYLLLIFPPLFCIFVYLDSLNMCLLYHGNPIRLLEVMERLVGCLELYLILS